MSADRLAVAGPRAWRIWLRPVLGVLAATLAVRAAALAAFTYRGG